MAPGGAQLPLPQAGRGAREGAQEGQRVPLEEARRATRVPPGHPEAFIEAFANVYAGVTEAVRAKEEGREPEAKLPFPNIHDGARGVYFIEKVVESAASEKSGPRYDSVPRPRQASSTPTARNVG